MESTNGFLWCDHSNESYWALLCFCTVHNFFLTFRPMDIVLELTSHHSPEKNILSITFLLCCVVLFVIFHKVVPAFESVYEIVKCIGCTILYLG